jgi:hypothetical protein
MFRKTVKHPSFIRRQGAYLNDLGLLFVEFPVHHVAFVRAICLSTLEPPFNTMEDLLILGWGVETEGRRSVGLKHSRVRQIICLHIFF